MLLNGRGFWLSRIYAAPKAYAVALILARAAMKVFPQIQINSYSCMHIQIYKNIQNLDSDWSEVTTAALILVFW